MGLAGDCGRTMNDSQGRRHLGISQPAGRSVKALHVLNSTVSRLVQGRGGPTMLWSLVDQFMVSGCNFLVGIAAARYLGIAEFGKFTLIMMIAGLATMVQSVIVAMPMVTLAGKRRKRSDSYFAAVTLWGATLSVAFSLATVLVVVAIYLAQSGAVSVLLILAVLSVSIFLSMHDVVRRVLFTQRRGGEAFLFDGLRFALFGAIVIWLHGSGAVVDAPMVLIAMGASAAAVTVPFAVSLVRARVRSRLFKRIWLRHWLPARWLVLMELVSTGQEQVIWIGVAAGLGDVAVGALRAGQYLLGITHFITMGSENFLPRQAAEEYRIGGVGALKSYLARQTVLLGAVTGILILAVALPARFWLTTVFGPAYADYASLVWIYSATYAAIFVRSIWVFYLRTIEDTRSVFRSFLMSSVLAVVCAWPAIAAFGVAGAAWAVLGAHVVCMISVLTQVRRHLSAAERTGHLMATAPGVG